MEESYPKILVTYTEDVRQPGFSTYGPVTYVHTDIWTFPTLFAHYLSAYEDLLEIPLDQRMHVTGMYPAHLEAEQIKDGIITYMIKRKPRELGTFQGQPVRALRPRLGPEKRLSVSSASVIARTEYRNTVILNLHAYTRAKLYTLTNRLETFIEELPAVFDQHRMSVVLLRVEELEQRQLEELRYRGVLVMGFTLEVDTAKVSVREGPAINRVEINMGLGARERAVVSEDLRRVLASVWGYQGD